MIITRTPFRITLGGGGTDLPSFYEQHGGYVFTMAINKYMFIALNRRSVADRKIVIRYSQVETADGHEVKLAEYLVKVWEVVGRLALEQILGTAEARARNGAGGALEEDARLTALFLWTLQSSNGKTNGERAAGSVPKEDK